MAEATKASSERKVCPDDLPVVAREIPKQLLSVVQIALEEKIYPRAIDLLSGLSFSGLPEPHIKRVKLDDGTKLKCRQIYIPPPSYLAIITTISLHPELTSKRRSIREEQGYDVAEKARRYLQTLIDMAGPVETNLKDVWNFRRRSRSTVARGGAAGGGGGGGGRANAGRGRRTRNRSASPIRDAEVGDMGNNMMGQHMEPFSYLDIAHNESLYNKCEDGWAFVGWALLCSVEYPRRWNFYKQFLEMLLDAVQADWTERVIVPAENEARKANEDAEDESVVKAYYDEDNMNKTLAHSLGFFQMECGSAVYKRMVSAIFANGSDESMRNWPAAFEYEVTKRPKMTAKDIFQNMNNAGSMMKGFTTNREGAFAEDLTHNMNGESSEDEIPQSMKRKMSRQSIHDTKPKESITVSQPKVEEEDDVTLDWGGMEAIVLRQRFMSMLSYLYLHDPDTIRSIYDQFGLRLRQMSIPEMSLFTSTLTIPYCQPDHINPQFRAALIQNALFSLMNLSRITNDSLCDEVLIEWYLPATASKNSLEDNTRVAVLIEHLARLWLSCSEGEGMQWTEEMDKATQDGIQARIDKVKIPSGKKKGVEELKAQMALSHERLTIMMQMCKMKASKASGK